MGIQNERKRKIILEICASIQAEDGSFSIHDVLMELHARWKMPPDTNEIATIFRQSHRIEPIGLRKLNNGRRKMYYRYLARQTNMNNENTDIEMS